MQTDRDGSRSFLFGDKIGSNVLHGGPPKKHPARGVFYE